MAIFSSYFRNWAAYYFEGYRCTILFQLISYRLLKFMFYHYHLRWLHKHCFGRNKTSVGNFVDRFSVLNFSWKSRIKPFQFSNQFSKITLIFLGYIVKESNTSQIMVFKVKIRSSWCYDTSSVSATLQLFMILSRTFCSKGHFRRRSR